MGKFMTCLRKRMAVILAACMVAGMMPTAAFGAEVQHEETAPAEEAGLTEAEETADAEEAGAAEEAGIPEEVDPGSGVSDNDKEAVAEETSDTEAVGDDLSDYEAAVSFNGTETAYLALSDAVSAWQAAGDGAILKLYKDVIVSDPLTVSYGSADTRVLDLNDHGIRYARGEAPGQGAKCPVSVELNATLEIRDSSSEKTTKYIILKDGRGDEVVSDEPVSGNYIEVTGGYLTGGHEGGVFNLGMVTMNGGNICGNASNAGGGVYNNGVFTLNGGAIFNNSATEMGGGVYNLESLYMTGGEIRENYSPVGGGVYTSKQFYMSGGEIYRNRADSGGGVYANRGSVSMTGGEIADNQATGMGNAICRRQTSGDGPSITFDSSSDIVVIASQDPRGTSARLVDYEPDLIEYIEIYGYIAVGRLVADVKDSDSERSYVDWDKAVAAWDSREGESILKLRGDVTIDKTLTVYGGDTDYPRVLDLNDHSITMTGSGSVISVAESGVLEMIDTGENGEGSITGGDSEYGGGVDNLGSFIMRAGKIANNRANIGGGVYSHGSFTMTGGVICNNTAFNGNGPALLIDGDEIISFEDSNILAGSSESDAHMVTREEVVSGMWDYGYLRAVRFEAMVIPAGGDATGYPLFQDAVDAWNTAGEGATLQLNTDIAVATSIKVSGGSEETPKVLDLNDHGIIFTGRGYSGIYDGDGVITVSDNACLKMTDSSPVQTRRYIKLNNDGRGTEVSSHNSIPEEPYIAVDGGYITGGDGRGGGGVRVEATAPNTYGTFILHDGSICGNSAGSGAGVYTARYAKFIMDGGIIGNNTAFYSGAGVYINLNCTGLINDGLIINNTANNTNVAGAGIYDRGNVEMYGGKIKNNNATHTTGGGVVIHPGCFFTLRDGEICGNKAKTGGGGVDCHGKFTMDGGEVKGNITEEQGGGVYISQACMLMNGGLIENNSAKRGGGIGVYDDYGSEIKMKGGVIRNNTASENGNAFYLPEQAREAVNFIGETFVSEDIDGTDAWLISPKSAQKNVNSLGYIAVTDVSGSDSFTHAGIDDQTYTGKQIKPEVKVYRGSTELAQGIDYTVKYSGNINVGKATFKITAKGNYSGQTTDNFRILAKNISDADVSISEIPSAKAGKKNYTPIPKLTYNGMKLKKGKDFTVFYYTSEADAEENDEAKRVTPKAAGTYYARVDGMGNYTGYRILEFAIAGGTDIPVSKLNILKIASLPYKGSKWEPEPVVKYGKKTLVKDTDYTLEWRTDNTEIGTGTVTVIGKAPYTGKKTVTFKITGYPMNKVACSGFKTSMVYDGTEKTQDMSLVYKTGKYTADVQLIYKTKQEYDALDDAGKAGVDCIITYKNNVNKGTASVVMKGINRCSGTVTKKYRITAYPVARDTDDKFRIELAQRTYPFAKAGTKPKPRVSFNGVYLTEGKDYKLSYTNNKGLNDATRRKKPTVKVTGIGNFAGTDTTTTFVIGPADISASGNTIKIAANDIVWKDKAGNWKSVVTLTDAGGSKLKAGADYDKAVEYYHGSTKLTGTEKLSAGDVVKVVVKAKGNNYKGQAETTYRISKLDISAMTATVDPHKYTGEAITIEPDEISWKLGRTPQTGVTVEIDESSYRNNIKAGTASVVVKGVGDCCGRKTVTYKIEGKSFGWWWELLIP